MSAEKIETIETIENTDRANDTPDSNDIKLQVEFENLEEENEFYLSMLYQMCVAA